MLVSVDVCPEGQRGGVERQLVTLPVTVAEKRTKPEGRRSQGWRERRGEVARWEGEVAFRYHGTNYGTAS